MLPIVLSVFFDLRILVISLVSVGHCVVCLLRFTYSCYLFGICWPLCCLSSSIYIFWFFLWYLLAIVLSVFFDLHILAISLVSVGHCVVCLLRFKVSAISLVSVAHCVVCLLRFTGILGYLFGMCCPLCCLSSSIYIFWLSLWYLLAIVLSVFFDLHILAISLVSVGHCVVCLLRFTLCCLSSSIYHAGYLFGICWPLCCLSSSIYMFWLSLWYLLDIGLSVFFELRILAISFVSFCHWFVCVLRFTNSGYLFEICWPLCCLSSLIYIFWLSLWYLLAIVFSVFFD